MSSRRYCAASVGVRTGPNSFGLGGQRLLTSVAAGIPGVENRRPALNEPGDIDNNAAAHIKSAIIGPSETIPIKENKLVMGTWQDIMLCEFDGPKQRKVIVKIIEG